MERFVNKYLKTGKKLRILDVGSYDINGTYKPLFNSKNWGYFGIDLEKGPNVNIISNGPYNFGVKKESFDVVISGQCLEHVKDVKEWVKQIEKSLKPGGLTCIIAPWQWEEHRHPVDCWRILPDGMRFLLEEICNFEILEIYKESTDCVGIAKKQ